MFLKNTINLKKLTKVQYKGILFVLLLLFLPSIFRILDHTYQKYLGLNRYLNVIDFGFVGLVLFCFFRKNKIKKIFSINIVLLFSFIFLARLSILFSEGELHHKAYYDLFKSSLVVLIFLSFSSKSFHENRKSFLKGFFTIFFTFALFETIVGILQFILQKRLGFDLLNEPLFSLGMRNSAKVYISENSQLFFSSIFPVKTNQFLRAHGTFIHPNVFSGFLNVSALLTLYFIYKSKKKLLFIFFLFLQLIALILTFSRAGLASFIVSSTLFIFLMYIKKKNIKKIALIYFCLMIGIGAIFSKTLLERGFAGTLFQSIGAKEVNLGSSNIRYKLQNISIKMIKKNPIFGIGFRSFLIKRNDFTNEKIERAYVHNIYLLIAAEIGLLSLFIFIFFISRIFYQILIHNADSFGILLICIVFSFLLIGIFDHYPISSHFGRIIMFTSCGYLNYLIKFNKPLSYAQKAFLYQ